MPLINWSDKMSVGVASLDEEHKKLVDLLNELHDGIQAGKAYGVLAHVLDALVSYTANHFKHEEELFARTGYPASTEHKREHDHLTGQVMDIQSKLKSGDRETLSYEVVNFLKNWLFNHIQGSDKFYGPYLNAKGIK
jgi:hemerythrin-like metal-binding protein